jgi:acyl carrier protein
MVDTTLKDSVRSKIKEILVNDLDANVNAEDVRDEVSLYEDGIGLDSISVVNLIVLIEKKFSISFEDADLNYYLFSSINHLTEVICKKIQ